MAHRFVINNIRNLFAFVVIISASTFSFSQKSLVSLSDSVKESIRPINYSNITTQAANIIIRINRINETIISDADIKKLKKYNDSITFQIDSMLRTDQMEGIDVKNIRSLNNRLVFWDAISSDLEDDKTKLASIIEIIDNHMEKLAYEEYKWEKTQKALTDTIPGAVLSNSISEARTQLNSVQQLLQLKSSKLISMMQEISELIILIVEYRDEIEIAIVDQKSNLFETHQSSVFTLDYQNNETWSIINPIKAFYLLEVKQLFFYIKQSFSSILFLVLAFLLFLFGFKRLQPFFKSLDDTGSFYLNRLNSISGNIFSMAIILTIFISVIIFPNRPELFKDLTRIIVVIPLLVLFQKIVHKRYFIYLYALLLLLLLQSFTFIFPQNHILYRLALMTMAFIELTAYKGLLKRVLAFKFKRAWLKRISLLFLVIHIMFSTVGFVAVFTGATRLAELCINAPIFNSFKALLITITVYILNGLIQLAIEESNLKNLNVVKLHGVEIVKKSIQLINVAAISLWVISILKILTIDTIIFGSVGGFFSKELNLGQISFTLGGVFIFFFIIWLSIVISKYINIALEKDVLTRFNLAKGVPHTIAILIRYTLITIGVVVAVGAAGLPLANFTILFGAFGVGIGFGLQNIFNNLVSGLILLFERPIQIGDTIEVGDLIGHVKSIGIRSSNIRTFDGAEVIVPNGQLISNEVVNWTLSDQTRRIEVLAGVSYSSDPHQVREILIKILSDHPDILNEPEPKVLFSSMGESSLDFRLLFWTQQVGEWLKIKSEITFSVFDELKKAGIEIPFPQRDLHIRSVGDSFNVISSEQNKEEN